MPQREHDVQGEEPKESAKSARASGRVPPEATPAPKALTAGVASAWWQWLLGTRLKGGFGALGLNGNLVF